MTRNASSFHPLRWEMALLLSHLWAAIGNAAALAERDLLVCNAMLSIRQTQVVKAKPPLASKMPDRLNATLKH